MTAITLIADWSRIDDLAPRALYALLKLRVDVFVVEQQCTYQEIDGRDLDAWHFRLIDRAELAAALRVLPPGNDQPARIGRVVVAPAYRGLGLGQRLMQEAIAFVRQEFAGQPIELGAQATLRNFYAGFGFVAISEQYIEDGIAHIDMRLDPQ